jgi:hypothetical protein
MFSITVRITTAKPLLNEMYSRSEFEYDQRLPSNIVSRVISSSTLPRYEMESIFEGFAVQCPSWMRMK